MRYFLEVAYKGTRYKGFQIQRNALTIQGEIEKAFKVLFKRAVELTGSSRTDAGVHARQNFFHFDWPGTFEQKWIYNLNAILPGDISINSINGKTEDAHCRFDALSRTYHYRVYQYKNPFLTDRSYFYPYSLDIALLNTAAAILKEYTDFTSFSKKNTQVKTFNCTILKSEWIIKDDQLIYIVSANRFLRGMVRALAATMLKVGRGTISLDIFRNIIESKDCSNTYFDAPAHGLTLMEVRY